MKEFKIFLLAAFSTALVLGPGCTTARLNHVDSPGSATVSATNANSAVVSPEFASPDGLTATLTNGNVILHWTNHATADGGNWVEFATPGSEYIKLDVFTLGGATTFVHPDLAPQTTFIYHILPFFGQSTAPVEITTGTSTNDSPVLDEGPIESTNVVSSPEKDPVFSIRSLQTFAQAAPTNLTATLSSSTSVDLHWRDCASDEDGYLVEIGASGDGTFYVCALLPPDATSFRKAGLPLATKCYFRVRAFFYGQASDTASATTPAQ